LIVSTRTENQEGWFCIPGRQAQRAARNFTSKHNQGQGMNQLHKALLPSPWIRAAIAVIPVISALLLGQWATFPNLASWYAGLVKPSFNPPNWFFAPVWTALYVLMAYAVWRVLKATGSRSDRQTALTLFFLQLALNALWSWLFFGMNNPLAGLLDIVPQFLLIVATIVSFRRLDAAAALCLVPLAAWVAFASLLNFEIWRLNG
jgi:tryptophan-rich sensory protein